MDQKQTTEQTQETQVSTRQALIRKLTSRKFIMSLVGVITGIIGMIGGSDQLITVVSFAIVTAASIIGYIISEGRVDAAAAQATVDYVDQLIKMIEELKSAKDANTAAACNLEPITCSTGYTEPLSPVDRAIYDTTPGSTTTISITKSASGDLEMSEITENNKQ